MKAVGRRWSSSWLATADEPASERQRLPHCSEPMLEPDDQDKTGQSLKTLAMRPPGEDRLAGRLIGQNPNHRVRSTLPDAIVQQQAGRQTSGFARRTGELEKARQARSADGSAAANL